ncbi:MAG: PP2C family protein-serine/threonine phosphatase [Phycisphaerae bacterium]
MLALIDPASGETLLASAGHCLPFILRASPAAPEELEADCGYPLGVVEDAKYATTTATLGRDPFVFVCYTDGVIEAMDSDQEIFGVERLLQVLSDVGAVNPQPLVKAVRRKVARFSAATKQSDDITVLAALIAPGSLEWGTG